MSFSVQRMRLSFVRPLRLGPSILVAALALVAGGCSSSSVTNLIDSLPKSVGLPSDTPDRPATPDAYPAVHDMPPPRPNSTLTAEQQVDLEKDLAATRARQETVAGTGASTPRQTRPAVRAPTPRVVPASSSNSIY